LKTELHFVSKRQLVQPLGNSLFKFHPEFDEILAGIRCAAEVPALPLAGVPTTRLGAVQLASEFAQMVRQREPDGFEGWLSRAEQDKSLEIRGFATSLRQDQAAVAAELKITPGRAKSGAAAPISNVFSPGGSAQPALASSHPTTTAARILVPLPIMDESNQDN
jgi:hypothetical protein